MNDLEIQRKKLKRMRLRVFIGALLMIGGTGGIFGNSTGVLFSAIIKDMGFSSQSLSLYYTLKTLVAGFTITFLTRLYIRSKLRPFCIAFSVIFILSYACMYFYRVPFNWYISGIAAGMAGIVSSIQPFILRNWFRERMIKFIGPTYMMTGVISALYSPVLSSIITGTGWRYASLVSGAIGSLLMLTASFLLIKDPKDVGLDLDVLEPRDDSDEAVQPNDPVVPEKYPLKSYLFVFFAIIGGSMGYQMATYIPQYTNLLGYELSFGALLTSLIMIGNLSSKLFVGEVNSRIGTRNGYMVYTGLVLMAFIMFLVFGNDKIIMMAASVLLGFSYAIGATAWSTLSMETFGSQNFEVPYSKLIMISNIYFSVIIYLLGMFFDITGSFTVDFIMSIVLCSLSFILLIIRNRKRG